MTKKTEQQVRAYLASLQRNALIEAVIERALQDGEYRRRLILDAARVSGEVDAAVFRRAIADALTSGSAGRRDYARTSGAWARSVDDAIDPVEQLLDTGNADEVIGIAEYALGRIGTLMGRIDDSSGWFADPVTRLEQLHHAACVIVRPEAVKLARRLFKLDVEGDWDILIDSAKTYADVLGASGLAEMQRLGDERWAQLPPSPPWGQRDRAPHSFHLTRMMTNLAEVADDVDAQVRVMARELDHPYRFLEIAQVLMEAQRPDDALAWAERGLDGPDDLPPHMRHDNRLDDFVLTRYLALDRTGDAIALLWRRFVDHPDLGSFRRLKTWTMQLGQWDAHRNRALDALREDAHRRSAHPQQSTTRAQTKWSGPPPKPAFEDVIAVLAFEGDLDEAWQLARSHGCTRSAWHDLAVSSEARRPLDAAEVYEREIEELIDRKQTHTYEQAIAAIGHLRDLYARADSSDRFGAVVDKIRHRHRQKTKFIKLLDAAMPGGI